MADLTILVPTRGRIGNALRLLDQFREVCQADTELVFVISADDPEHDLYYWHLTQRGGRAVTVSVDPEKPGVVAPLNAGFEAVKDSLGYAVGFMGDDHCPRTLGWDVKLLESLRELKTGIAYGNDLLQGEKMATAVVMTSEIPKTLGYMAPPSLQHYCLDLVWIDWGKGINKLAYREDVIIEHMHPVMRKAKSDATYGRTDGLLPQDDARYAEYTEKSLIGDLKRLTPLFTEPKPAAKKAPAKRAPRKAVQK